MTFIYGERGLEVGATVSQKIYRLFCVRRQDIEMLRVGIIETDIEMQPYKSY